MALQHHLEQQEPLHHVQVREQEVGLDSVLQHLYLGLRLGGCLGRDELRVLIIIIVARLGLRVLRLVLRAAPRECVPLGGAWVGLVDAVLVAHGRLVLQVVLHASESHNDDRDIIRAGLKLQPQVVGLRCDGQSRLLRVVIRGYHVHHPLAAHKLKHAVAGDHEELHIGLQPAHRHLWLGHHADSLRGTVADTPREGGPGVHAVVGPQPRRVAIILLLCPPALGVGVLEPLQLVQGQHTRAAPLDAGTLIAPEGRLVRGEVHSHQLRALALCNEGARVPDVGGVEVSASKEGGDASGATHGVINLLVDVQLLVGDHKSVVVCHLWVGVKIVVLHKVLRQHPAGKL
mmetsp:Transcript_34321/g.97220  ORF Transcript_34321/g.97220 Transcript_34321/m.97220 type:complete len:345 (-) Transcript_34321:833-1867(-)